MTEDEYRETQTALISLSAAIRDLPLEAMSAALQRADAVGPILHPTLYKQAIDEGNYQDIKKLLAAALRFKHVAKEVANSAALRVAKQASR